MGSDGMELKWVGEVGSDGIGWDRIGSVGI